MSSVGVTRLLYHPNTSLLDIRPCDTANASDTKTHWSSEEIHRIMGCQKFCNYKHILSDSHDAEWVDGGKFPMSVGLYATELLFQKKNGADLLIGLPTNFSMPSTWISLLVTASLLGDTGMLLFWFIAISAIMG